MKPAISGTYSPANGLWMTASAAARLSGVAATGPPSWKTSSTTMTRLRSCTSGMQEAPLRTFDCNLPHQERNNARAALQAERRRMNQTASAKGLRHAHARSKCGEDLGTG